MIGDTAVTTTSLRVFTSTYLHPKNRTQSKPAMTVHTEKISKEGKRNQPKTARQIGQ